MIESLIEFINSNQILTLLFGGLVRCLYPLHSKKCSRKTLAERLGDRVREVKCAHTSQECSCCGNVEKSARKGKIYACLVEICMSVLDADVNASRNILRRGLESLRT